MQYFITFLEGLISFISPCMLPMLPIYISYFAGGSDSKKRIFSRALAFILGFTIVFCALGLFAGTVGSFLSRYRTVVNIVCGVFVIIFGLSYLEIIPLNFLKGIKGEHEIGSIFSAFVFGLIYSVSLTPCVGAFLGSALMIAASEGGAFKGFTLLLAYSLGLGVPFLFSAVLIEKFNGMFDFIKKHYKVINIICGVFLIIVGVFIACGMLNRLLAILS